MSDNISNIILSNYQKSKIDHDDEQSDDEIFELLENDEQNGFNAYREARIQQMSKQMNNIKSQINKGYGMINICDNESELINLLENTSFLLVHFTNNQFQTCRIMHQKLEIIARKHINIRILEIEAQNAFFLTSKMNIKILPFVLGYSRGKETLRLTGFEQLGNSQNFSLNELENLLLKSGLINSKDIELNIDGRKESSSKENHSDNDYDDDE